jgi:hypothetical protein
MIPTQSFAAILLGLLAVASGCSGSSVSFTDTVEGTLTLDNVPVADALVQFVPAVPETTKAPESSGVTDAKGFFRLARSDNHKPGAAIGPHRVVILPGRAAQDRNDPNAQDRAPPPTVPADCMSLAKTPIRIEVTKDQKTYDLPIRHNAGR